jgi:hypothetical protein
MLLGRSRNPPRQEITVLAELQTSGPSPPPPSRGFTAEFCFRENSVKWRRNWIYSSLHYFVRSCSDSLVETHRDPAYNRGTFEGTTTLDIYEVPSPCEEWYIYQIKLHLRGTATLTRYIYTSEVYLHLPGTLLLQCEVQLHYRGRAKSTRYIYVHLLGKTKPLRYNYTFTPTR